MLIYCVVWYYLLVLFISHDNEDVMILHAVICLFVDLL